MAAHVRGTARTRLAAEVGAQYDSGGTIRGIAAGIGMSYTATRQLLILAGVRFRPRFGSGARDPSLVELDARTRVCAFCGARAGKCCRSVNGLRTPVHAARRQSPPTSPS